MWTPLAVPQAHRAVWGGTWGLWGQTHPVLELGAEENEGHQDVGSGGHLGDGVKEVLEEGPALLTGWWVAHRGWGIGDKGPQIILQGDRSLQRTSSQKSKGMGGDILPKPWGDRWGHSPETVRRQVGTFFGTEGADGDISAQQGRWRGTSPV